ncbi:sigma-54 interaction domain-containing protein [Gudongella sp. DL1XJH-153]|uniref:sigma-54 interaction domain-containing protein n=1 Tax=Gudongella sp. DL1XJH-153 TaxID=3409804 RepID=UPI003BB5C323
MSLLNSIRSELQHIVEAMYSVTNVDITIVDQELKRVVGTGVHGNAIGMLAPLNSAFHKCITTGEQYLIEKPREESICIDCENRENCVELVEICLPIDYNGEIIGVLGLCAFDEIARNNLLTNTDGYRTFENQLTGIINTMLKEKDYGQMLEYRSNEMFTLINSLNEGIVVLDKNQRIATMNSYIQDKLNIKDNATGLSEIIPESVIIQLSETDFSGEIGPVSIGNDNYIIQSNPIEGNNLQQGYILIFSDFNKMKKSVLKSQKVKDIVTFDHILGESESIKSARRQAIQVAESEASVMIMGETGTGKEVFARAIHHAGKRSDQVFMALNCGAIPENLIESELFGYEQGSFTGANKTGRQGYFEAATKGTLFLDEIGELPYLMQVKLLRALEEKEITRIGGHKGIKVNPRIISATHRNIDTMAREGTFREDLFYRLNIVPIQIPPLRDRGYDVLILGKYFLEHFGKVYGKEFIGFSQDAENLLLKYRFPGNIRELKNLIEYAVIFSDGSKVTAEHIKGKIPINLLDESRTLTELTREYERELISSRIQMLGEGVESKKILAKKLGISLATLYRKLD